MVLRAVSNVATVAMAAVAMAAVAMTTMVALLIATMMAALVTMRILLSLVRVWPIGRITTTAIATIPDKFIADTTGKSWCG